MESLAWFDSKLMQERFSSKEEGTRFFITREKDMCKGERKMAEVRQR